jgi:hypothetical protein
MNAASTFPLTNQQTMTTDFPKSVEAPVLRFFHSPVTWDSGVKNGGMTAVVKLPDGDWNDVLVYEPDAPDETWWDVLPRNTVIRAAIREPAKKNPKDLIAFALPLKNQPSATQKLLAQLMDNDKADDQPNQPEPTDGDKLEAQLKEEVEKKQRNTLLIQRSKRLQRLILMGEWLEKNESALKCIQSTICTSVFRWYDDNTEEADSTALHEMLDALHLSMDLIRDMRQKCWCPDTDCDGILYYTDGTGKPVEVINLNEVS